MSSRSKSLSGAKASSKANVKNTIKINIGDVKKQKRRKTKSRKRPLSEPQNQAIPRPQPFVYTSPFFPQYSTLGLRQPIQPIQPNRNLGADVPNTRLLTNIAERLGRIEASGDILTRQVQETASGLGEIRSTMNLPRQERIKIERSAKKPAREQRDVGGEIILRQEDPKPSGIFSGIFSRRDKKPEQQSPSSTPKSPKKTDAPPQRSLLFSPPNLSPTENPALSRQAQVSTAMSRLPLASVQKRILERMRVEDLRELAQNKGVGFYRTRKEGKISPDKKPGDKYTKERLIQRLLEHDIELGDLFDDLGGGGAFEGGGGATDDYEGRMDDL